ncbi:MAG TPA: WD40 repeat domain-containing protein, partial [Negativicutes bacterium]|nr:WD40 repeat domain-containing protein [Negativicutes bacterium]
KKIYAVLLALMLVLSGCSGNVGKDNTEAGEIKLDNERLVKEFTGTVNIFHRAGDELLLSTEEGDYFKYYDVNIGSTEVKDSQLTEMADKYIYYEPVGSSGFLLVEELDSMNTLKFMGKDGAEKVIAEDIGPADSINISISPKGGKLAYTSRIEGSDVYGIYVYDTATSKSSKIMDIQSDGLIEGFSYLISWSPDEKSIIIHDKYIYDTGTGMQIGEIKSAYSEWSPSGTKIAFILDDGSEPWLPTADYQIYPGKKVCVYDIAKGSYDVVFTVEGEEYIFGGVTWGGNDSLLAFPGVKVKDINQQDWYMKLNYSSLYIVGMDGGKSKRIETNADASDGSMIELTNIKFSDTGRLLSFTVGNYEKSVLNIVNTSTLEAKSYENTEYLHWIDGENFTIAAAGDRMYFSSDNSIMVVDDKLQEKNIYKSIAKLDDFYLSEAGIGIMIFELADNIHTARYIGQ